MFIPDSDGRGRPLTSSERWISAIFLAVFFGLFFYAIFENFHPAKLSALFIVLFWIPLLVLHEAGHAAAAWLLGWHVGQVVIGVGPIVGSFRTGSAAVTVRLLPVEGFVQCVPTNLRRPQFKSALIYFAGPGVELLLAVLILLILGPDNLLVHSDDYLIIAWQSLALAAAAQAVINLIPSAAWTPAGDIANDGLGIIRSFTKPNSYYADMIRQAYNEREKESEAPW